MYTENELEISNKSYTNKDFATIYPELLDLVKKLTNKWDPTISNESDPGVVLLKLAALIADKNNYNIDKNILETFPLSVTQTANARKLYDMLGYNMNWYKAADIKISFTYTKDVTSEIRIPKWTMITDDTSTIVYTILKDCVLSLKGVTESVDALQGTLHEYEINGVRDITLDNLDQDLRLFFTDRYIAENGIFVTNKGNGTATSEDYWTKVDNLESYTLNEKIYKFGILPNSDTCYILFPQDIGNLIENGINIKYLITQGSAGNIKANTLTTFYEEVSLEDGSSINADTIIQNVESTSNGKDPEDLDSAYTNYKKTVGTFDTLVTLRDYENAIYTATDTFDNPLVSNVVVSDRTCDLRRTTNVVQRTTSGTENVSHIDTEEQVITGKGADGQPTSVRVSVPVMDAFDIGLYILDAVKNVDNEYYYNKTFSVSNDLLKVHSVISEKKCINHEYISTDDDTVEDYLYKAFYKLQGKIITYYKVTQVQATEIENNIKKALYKKYNARNVNFGQPVNYDDIIATIQGSDTRIKTVVLAEPEYILRAMRADDSVGTFESSRSPLELQTEVTTTNGSTFSMPVLLEFLAKMILAGNVQLYNFNRDVNFKFGLKNIVKYGGVRAITTESSVSTTNMIPNSGATLDTVNGYELSKNENLQLYAPNLYTKTSYTSYVNYELKDSEVSEKTAENVTKTSTDTGYEYTFVIKDYLYKDYPVSVEVNSGNGATKINGVYCTVTESKATATVDNIAFVILKGPTEDADPVFKYTVDFIIPQDCYYLLKSTLSILVNYTDSNQNVKFELLEPGTIVKFSDSSDTVAVLGRTASTLKKLYGGGEHQFSTLTASQQIDVLDINKVVFKDANNVPLVSIPCMWFTNDKVTVSRGSTTTTQYKLFDVNETEKILQDNEYFIYTNQDRNELVILGSGTMIKRSSEKKENSITFETTVSASALISEGLSAISDTDWFEFFQSKYGQLELVELQIITLGEGAGFRAASITVDNDVTPAQSVTSITNQPVRVTGGQYCEKLSNPEWKSLVEYTISNSPSSEYIGWKLRTKLNIMLGADYPQTLLPNQTMTLTILKEEEVNTGTISWLQGDDIWSVSLGTRQTDSDVYYYEFPFDGVACRFTITTSLFDEGEITGTLLVGTTLDSPEQFDVTSGIFMYEGIRREVILSTSTKTVTGENIKTDIEISSKSLMSNTVIGSAGGENLSVSSTSNTDVDFYSYEEVDLPHYTDEKNEEIYLDFDKNGEMPITYHFYREYKSENPSSNITLLFSYNGRKFSDTAALTESNKIFIIPLTLQGIVSSEVTVKAISTSGQVIESSVVELTQANPVAYMDVEQQGSTSFGGIQLSGWEIDTSTMQKYDINPATTSSTGAELATVNGITYYYKVSGTGSSTKLLYKSTSESNWSEVTLDGFFKLGSAWLQFISNTSYTKFEVVTLNMLDFLQIGLIFIVEGSAKYSEQVETTLNYIARNYEKTNTEVLSQLLAYVEDPVYKFDRAYIVPEEDKIDTETTNDYYKHNLFSSTALFDTNHILNKYLIPQLVTTPSLTSVKVASQSITK